MPFAYCILSNGHVIREDFNEHWGDEILRRQAELLRLLLRNWDSRQHECPVEELRIHEGTFTLDGALEVRAALSDGMAPKSLSFLTGHYEPGFLGAIVDGLKQAHGRLDLFSFDPLNEYALSDQEIDYLIHLIRCPSSCVGMLELKGGTADESITRIAVSMCDDPRSIKLPSLTLSVHDSEAISAVGGMIRSNIESLRDLHLELYRVAASVLRELIDCVAQNRTLRTLSIYDLSSENAISLTFDEVFRLVRSNTPLRLLDVEMMDGSDMDMQALEHALQQNSHLTELRIDYLPRSSWQVINIYLEANRLVHEASEREHDQFPLFVWKCLLTKVSGHPMASKAIRYLFLKVHFLFCSIAMKKLLEE